MEINVFTAPAVAEILMGMVEARLHTDKGDEVNNRQKELQVEMTDSVATPIYVVQDPVSGEKLVGEMKATYLQDPEAFAAMLSRARKRLALVEGERPKVAAR